MQDILRVEVKEVSKSRNALVLTYYSDDLDRLGRMLLVIHLLAKSRPEVVFGTDK